MYTKYSKKESDQENCFNYICNRKNLTSRFYNDSAVKSLPCLITKPDVPSNATELPRMQNLLFSCIPAFPWHKGKEKSFSLFRSSPIGVNPACSVPPRCAGPACLNLSPVPRAVRDASVWCCFSVRRFSPGTGGRKEKQQVASPEEGWKQFNFPHKARGKREETILRPRAFPG